MSDNLFLVFIAALFVCAAAFVGHFHSEVHARRWHDKRFGPGWCHVEALLRYDDTGLVPRRLVPSKRCRPDHVEYLPLDDAWVVCGRGRDDTLGTSDDRCLVGPLW